MKKVGLLFLVYLLFLPLDANADGKGRCCKRKPTPAERRKAEIKRIAMVRAANKAAAERRIRLARERADRLQIENLRAESSGQNMMLREFAINALGSWNGTAIITEVKTGEVVAAVFQDTATSKAFHPCSTVKLCTALAGLNESVIDEQGLIVGLTNKYLGSLTLDDAIGYSNNAYFDAVGAKVGGSDFLETAKKVGLGQKTKFNLPGENPGKLPSVVTRSNEYSHAYNIRVTALQLNALALEIANSRKPGSSVVPKEHLQRLIPGMIIAAESGTAKLSESKLYDLKLAGKTGTCQGTGAFTGFVPHDDPLYAVTVIITGGGGKHAAQIAGNFLKPMKAQGLLDPETQQVADQSAAKVLILQ